MLNEELIGLTSFAEKHQSILNDDVGIPHSEWSSLWQYYNALYNTLSYAVQQCRYANVMTDKVWELDDNWWVKDGSITAADVEENAVYPTITMRKSQNWFKSNDIKCIDKIGMRFFSRTNNNNQIQQKLYFVHG